MYYYHEVDDWGPFYAEFEIEYRIYPGEPVVRYLPDGSGYPGSPPEVEIISVRVVHLGDSKHVYIGNRDDYKDWVKELDDLAFQYVEKWDLYHELLIHAEVWR